jgi:hypothetical protein
LNFPQEPPDIWIKPTRPSHSDLTRSTNEFGLR